MDLKTVEYFYKMLDSQKLEAQNDYDYNTKVWTVLRAAETSTMIHDLINC